MTHAALTAWDVSMIRRIDAAVRLIGTPSEPAPSKTDTKGLKAMLRGVVAQKAKRAGDAQK